MSENKTELVYYKAKDCIFVAHKKRDFMGSRYDISSLRINGATPEDCFRGDWKIFRGVSSIDTVEKYVRPSNVLSGYKLKNEALASDSIPKFISAAEANMEYDDDDNLYFVNFPDIAPLYESVYKKTEESWEPVELTAELIGEIEVSDHQKIQDRIYKVRSRQSFSDYKEVDFDIFKNVSFSELEQILTPSFALHDRPCQITSQQTYDIVRNHVKNNIDPKKAEISSDYNFCFKVNKKVRIKPYQSKYETKKNNGKSYSPPRVKINNVTFKSVEVFEMTFSPENYKGYTPIAPIKGDTLEDLVNNIRTFLDELMFKINEDVKECECCGGTGHILE